MFENMEAICEAITNRRRFGRVTCRVRGLDMRELANRKNVQVILDDFVRSFGFKGLSEGWIEVSVDIAKSVVRGVLFKDLAYNIAMMTEQEASSLADAFFSLFDQPVRCFTNGNLVVADADPSEVPGAWTSNSDATFDAGIVCIGIAQIGILWAEDED